MKPSPRGIALAITATLFLAGCSSSRLAKYDFNDATVAVVVAQPASPQMHTNSTLSLDPANLVASAARAGAVIAKEVSAEKARERMVRAMQEVDLGARMADRTLDRAAVYLRAEPVYEPREADYVLDIWIHEYGIEMDAWDSEAFFRIRADVMLLDGATGRRIWKQRVRAKDTISRPVTLESMFDDILTAEALSRLSDEEMVVAFERLADLTADRFARELRKDLERARR